MPTIYSDKARQLVCRIVYFSRLTQAAVDNSIKAVSFIHKSVVISSFPLPIIAKIDISIVQYIDRVSLDSTAKSALPEELIRNQTIQDHVISFEFSNCNHPIESILLSITENTIASKNGGVTCLRENANLNSWETVLLRLAQEHSLLVFNQEHNLNCFQLPDCPLLSSKIKQLPHSMEASVKGISSLCLASYTYRASINPHVLRISINPAPTFQNFEARGIVQTDRMDWEPFTHAGLTGKGQVVGVADSGVNDLSCFLMDNSDSYTGILTDRNGTIERNRRKIIQYVAFADEVDVVGGHGTVR